MLKWMAENQLARIMAACRKSTGPPNMLQLHVIVTGPSQKQLIPDQQIAMPVTLAFFLFFNSEKKKKKFTKCRIKKKNGV